MTLYEKLVDAGVQIDHWECDLYVPVNRISTRLVKKSQLNYSLFKDAIDQKPWYDIPRAYDPHPKSRKHQEDRKRDRIQA